MLPNKTVRERLDSLVQQSREDDYSSISALIGKNHAYIQQFIQRGIPKRLKEEDRRTIARYFKVPEWELGSPFQGQPGSAHSPGFSDFGDDGIVMIPSYDISASAGFGAFVEREWTDNFMPFQNRFINSLTQSNPDNLSILKVCGDSMTPTLSDGDCILVDTLETALKRDGIYVIRNDDTLSVKRISVNPSTGLLAIKSDNPLYETWPDCKPSEVNIIGQVIWVGRNL
ncbi:MAG: helix-turn-helix transcriptional regulator [Proteobacteria bacterium]|nr:helix-turn-helix transcriptional regulator [Pseudomonadota bacterium]